MQQDIEENCDKGKDLKWAYLGLRTEVEFLLCHVRQLGDKGEKHSP